MNKLAALVAILGAAAFVFMSSIYTVSEVEQMIITQFGKPVGEPVTTAGLKTRTGVGREPLGHADQGQALYLCRFVRSLADY